MKYVIIGAGAAGISAAKTLLELDKSGDVVIISADKNVYSRCMLHYVIAGKRDLDSISFIEKDFFSRSGISWIKEKKVVNILSLSQEVILEDGSKIPYDKLLIAAGSKAGVPPIKGLEDAGNVFKLRDISDVEDIIKAASLVRKAIVLGAGLIGLDVASALMSIGLQVTIVEMADRVLPIQLDYRSAYNYQKIIESMGAKVLTSVSVLEAVKGVNGNVESVKLNNGNTVECDMIVTAVGVRPNTEFIHATTLEINRGIQVDDRMQTSVSDIYAAGDITGISGIWPSATKQGMVAAYNMVGKEEYFTDYFTAKNAINLFDLGTVSIGIPIAPDDSYVEETYEKDGVYKKIIHKDGVVYGIILQKDVSRSGFWTKVIKDKLKIDTSVKNVFNTNYADFFCINEKGSYDFAQH